MGSLATAIIKLKPGIIRYKGFTFLVYTPAILKPKKNDIS